MVPKDSNEKKARWVVVGREFGRALKMEARYVDQTPPVMQLYDALFEPTLGATIVYSILHI
jgi:hypothetical protein